MEVIKETLWKRCLSTPTKPPAKNSNICLSETAYQHKGTRKKCKKTNQAAIIQWQRQCLMYKPHHKPKSKTSDISKQSPSPLHHTFLLGRACFTAQPLSALVCLIWKFSRDGWRTAFLPGNTKWPTKCSRLCSSIINAQLKAFWIQILRYNNSLRAPWKMCAKIEPKSKLGSKES